MTDSCELALLMIELFVETEEGKPEKPVLFTDRAKEIIREISGYSHMTGLWQKCQQEAETCYGRKKTPEQIFMAMVCNANKEETLDWCFENLHKKRVPEANEFFQNTRFGGAKNGDYGYYFAGYYTIEVIDSGFKFTYVRPWDG